MSINTDTITGTLTPIQNRVIVSDMFFGEQKTAGGLIIGDDDGKTRGIYPRWAKVQSIGPYVKGAEYKVGQWILIEHGRWSRGQAVDDSTGLKELRMVESQSILAYSEEKPEGLLLGNEYTDGQHATVDPSSFINQ